MELAIVMTPDVYNPDVGDLRLGPDGNCVVLNDLLPETAQRLFVRLNFFQGEWFRDALEGTPYFQQLLKKGVSDKLIRAIFTSVILGTEGVASMTKFNYTVSKDRRMTLNFECRLLDGSVFRSFDFQPFQVVL